MNNIAYPNNHETPMFPTGYDLRTLFIFTCVVEAGGMTQAAKVLKMTQSSVSQAIGNLEDALGAPLFDRSVRPMTVTVAGNTLYERSKALIDDANILLRDTQDSENLTYETLTLGLAESFANAVGPRLVTHLPGLARKWRVLAGTSPILHESLVNHEVDIILSTSDQLLPQKGLSIFTVLEEPYVLVFPKDYDGPLNGITNVEGLPFIRCSLRSSIGRQTERQLDRMRLKFPMHSEFDTATGQLEMVRLGAGWTLSTPMCLLQEYEKLDRLKVAPIQRGNFSRKLTLIARSAEMGRTAERIALTSQDILKNELFPKLFAKLPWLKEKVVWDFT